MSSRQEVRQTVDKVLEDVVFRSRNNGMSLAEANWGSTPEAQAEMDRVMML